MRASLRTQRHVPVLGVSQPPLSRSVAPRSSPERSLVRSLPPPVNADPAALSLLDAILLKSGVRAGPRAARIPSAHFIALHHIREQRQQLAPLPDEALAPAMRALRDQAQRSGIDGLAVEGLALISEALRRKLGVEPYDVQVLAALSLLDQNSGARGSVVELDTGEGKTFVVAMAAAVRALEGKGVHVLTANSTLAGRDAEKLEPALRLLGLSLAVVREPSEQSRDEKRAAYAADISYSTAEALGFDFLIDCLATHPSERVQRGQHAVIVDEADHVLIDSAQTPLLLSGDREPAALFAAKRAEIQQAGELVRSLDVSRHVRIIERDGARVPLLTEAGMAALSAQAGELWSPSNASLLQRIHQALVAEHGFRLNKDYLKQDGKIVIVDQGTGLSKPSSSWSDGLHEAISEKEGLPLTPATRLLGEITLQGYFGRYRHLSGITGTASEAEDELRDVYAVRVLDVPRHLKNLRKDQPDAFFVHPALRDLAALEDLAKERALGRPVLVSTVSVAAADRISARLADPRLLFAEVALSSPVLYQAARHTLPAARATKADTDEARRDALVAAWRRHPQALRSFARFLELRGLAAPRLLAQLGGIPHQHVTAATSAAEEMAILAVAGRPGAVTVGTQKLGRGVDIKLDARAQQSGGLFQLGIERQTNLRKDRQLRGRSGRNGDRGSSKFYVSLGDEVFSQLPAHQLRQLCRLFSEDRVEQPRPALTRVLSAALEQAQQAHELEAASARRRMVSMDQVIQAQRHAILSRRDVLLTLPGDALLACLEDWLVGHMDRALLLRSVLPPSGEDMNAIVAAHRDQPAFIPASVLNDALARAQLSAVEQQAGPLSVADLERGVDAQVSALSNGRSAGLARACQHAAHSLARTVVGDHLYQGTRPTMLSEDEIERVLTSAVEAGQRVSLPLCKSVLAALGPAGARLAATLPPRALGMAEALELSATAIESLLADEPTADRPPFAALLSAAAHAALAEPFADRLRAPPDRVPSAKSYHGRYVAQLLAGLGAVPAERPLPASLSLEEVRREVRRVFGERVQVALKQAGEAVVIETLRQQALGALDHAWVEYQTAVPELKEGAALAVYRQANPRVALAQTATRAMAEIESEVVSLALGGVLSSLSSLISSAGAKQ